MPLLKLCGLRSRRDVELADTYADYAGFILGPLETPRRLAPSEAADLASTLSRAVPVLVSTHASPLEAIELASRLGVFRVIQYHGALGPAEAAEAAREAASIGLGFAPVSSYVAASYTPCSPAAYEQYYPGHEYILLDAAKKLRHPIGPAGLKTPPSLVERVARRVRRLGVAGGVNPFNAAIVAAAEPYLVDVASGVESSPGVKDEELVAMVARIVRGRP